MDDIKVNVKKSAPKEEPKLDSDGPADPQPQPSPEKPKGHSISKGRKIFHLFVVLFLFLSTVGVSVLYFTAANDAADKDDEITSLQNQVDKFLLNEAGDAVDTEDEADSSATTPEESGESDAAAPGNKCDDGTDYTATVGKFELVLSNPNVIAVENDGGAEGGPITVLSVFDCKTGENNVVESGGFAAERNIWGNPQATAAEFQTSWEGQNGLSGTTLSSVSFDGVNATVVQYDGLITTYVAYFDNAGIGYQVEIVAGQLSDLNEIAAGWSFTP